ncbi:dimethylarginine dimethylaminohydrolase family protein [Marinicella sediminis]|uniref:Dimethylarginine dimethylaminohydrolase family protein n=1 Tax=Marinicella sediminis TaxID=1792834 RepID=A0ABV7JAZ0_9GAMM|nr:arginine deiminase family protein [Marinicella sediminis]
MFSQAIVKQPSESLINGITEANLGLPDIQLAREQHKQYIKALELCGLSVTVLSADETYPDGCFVEDPAIITPAGAIITRPGAASRTGECEAISQALKEVPLQTTDIHAPGTLDGGDVMMVDSHYYIGLSERTNPAGANQLIQILESWGLSGSTIQMKDMLHLKTGVSYLENNTVLVCGEFLNEPAFQSFHRLAVAEEEAYAANCIWVNDRVIMPAGYPRTQAMIESAGYQVLSVDVSEFRKLDGGLSCLSLRF